MCASTAVRDKVSVKRTDFIFARRTVPDRLDMNQKEGVVRIENVAVAKSLLSKKIWKECSMLSQ